MSYYDLPEGYGAFSGEDQSEEKTCLRCLELESECYCEYYDQLEEEELKQIRLQRSIIKEVEAINETNIHPLFNEILAIIRPPEAKKRKVKHKQFKT